MITPRSAEKSITEGVGQRHLLVECRRSEAHQFRWPWLGGVSVWSAVLTVLRMKGRGRWKGLPQCTGRGCSAVCVDIWAVLAGQSDSLTLCLNDWLADRAAAVVVVVVPPPVGASRHNAQCLQGVVVLLPPHWLLYPECSRCWCWLSDLCVVRHLTIIWLPPESYSQPCHRCSCRSWRRF